LYGAVTTAQTLVRVVNNETKEPVPYASVSFENIKNNEKSGAITNDKGELSRSLKGLTIVKVSSVGYLTRSDTIEAAALHIIYLIPADIKMDDVVITASAKPQVRDKSIYKIDVISNAQIRERAAANISDLLETQPGVRVEQNGSLGSSVRIQGLSSEQVKILIDGVPVVGRVNGNIDLNQLNLRNADHVEIIEGPMSVIYGSDAMGGLINIITKENTRKKVEASSDLYYETIGKYNAGLSLSLHKKSSTISISGSRNFFQGAALAGDPARVQTWKPRLQYNFDGSYIYVKNTSRLKYSFSLFNEEYRILGTPRKDSIPVQTDTTLIYHAIANDAINITRRISNKLEYSISHKNNSINLVGSYSSFWRSLNTYKNDLTLLEKTREGVANQDTQRIASVMVRGIWSNTSIKNVEIFGGTEFNYDHAVDKTDFGTKEMTDIAGFINIKYNPFQSVSIQPGIRFIHNSLFSSPIVYAFNLKYQPDKKWSARLSYAKGFRSPSLKELYFKYTQLDHLVYGNPDLKAEYSNNTSASVNYTTPLKTSSLGITLSGFYNQIKNKIDYLQDPNNELKAQLINLPINLYKNYGGNLGLSLQMFQQLTLETGVGITAVSTLKNSSSFNYSENYSGSLNYRNSKSLYNISINYKYIGHFVIYSAQLMNDGTYNVTNESIAGGYHNMDALISKQLLDKRIDVGVGVKNIFNNTRVNLAGNSTTGGSAGLVGYGRTYFIKFTYRLN
jgi:outer membrane receptor for ferrienterochelin and colicins